MTLQGEGKSLLTYYLYRKVSFSQSNFTSAESFKMLGGKTKGRTIQVTLCIVTTAIG